MQVKSTSVKTFKIPSTQRGYSNNQFDFLSSQIQSSSINKQTTNKMLVNDYDNTAISLGKDMTQNSSSSKVRPESYVQNLYLDSNALDYKPQFFRNQSTQRLTSKPFMDIPSSNISPKQRTPYTQSGAQQTRQITLLIIQNQSLKAQNGKINENVKRLRSQLQQKAQMLRNFNKLMKVKYNELKEIKAESEKREWRIQDLYKQKEKQVSSQQVNLQQTRRLKQALIRKNKQLDQITTKINDLIHENFRNSVYQMKISKLKQELQQQKSKSNNFYIQNSRLSQKIKQLQEQAAILQYQERKVSIYEKLEQFKELQKMHINQQVSGYSPSKSSRKSQQQSHLKQFDQALKVQMKQIQQLKQTIQTSQQLIQKLKDNLASSRRQLQELRNQMKIVQIKAISQRKKVITEYILQIHQKDTQISSAFKKYKTLEGIYKNALLDIKAKDQFFRQHLVGRVTETTIQEYIQQTLKKYVDNFQDIIQLKATNQELVCKLEKYMQYEEFTE